MQGRRGLTGRMVVSAVVIQLIVATWMVAGPSAVSAASSGSVTGSVISASGGAALGGICATLYTRTGVRTGDSPACTNAQGVYRMTVANAGSYDVQFSDPSQTYVGQWYKNQPTWTTATAVRVRSGRTTSGVNAVLVRAAIGSAPVVTGVSPAIGPTSGGTSVTISGSNLSGATAVRFGATLGIITSGTATQVVATSPAGSGVVDITVTSAAGTSATGASDRFTYQAGTTPSITAVGTLRTHTNQPSQASESISVSPAAMGDVLAMAIETKFPSGVQSFTAATVSGGGVTTWIKARSSLTIDGIHDQELWWGVVTTPGSSTITVTFTAGSTSGNAESATALDVQEFRASSGVSTVWSIDSTGVVDTGVATTAPNYPTLTPTSAGEAYFGYLAVPGAISAGPTPGVVYQGDARGNQCVYDQSVSSTITPVASGSSQTFFSIGMLLRAAIGSAPVVTGVSPAIGPTSGGTSVTISGSNLSGATAVRFGATLGIITSGTATQVVATSPAGSGVVDITVTSAAGTSATGASDRFTYQAGTTPSITAVGTLRTHTNQPSQASESISVSPAATGDVLAMAIETKFPSGVQSFTAATVSGGGVTTWIKARSSLTIDGIHDQELWWGVVTTPGSSTITVTFTAGSTSGNAESATALDVQEFRASSGVSTVWSIDSTGVVDTGVATTAPNYPTLTPTSAGEAYFGYLAVPGAISAGPTPGVVYQGDARGNQCVYDQSVSSTITPVASGSSQTFFSIGMLVRAA